MPNKLVLGEALMSDERLHRVANRLAAEFRELLAFGFDLITWVQEPRVAEVNGHATKIPHMATLGIISPHPKQPNVQKLSQAAMLLDHWRAEEQEFNRLVGRPDPALKFYRVLARHHTNLLKSLSELNDASSDR